MATVNFTVYPLVKQNGECEVPEEIIARGENAMQDYIREQFASTELFKPDFDYDDTEIDINYYCKEV